MGEKRAYKPRRPVSYTHLIDSMVKKAVETDADVVIASHYYKNKKQEIELSERLYCGTEIKEILMVHMMGNNGNPVSYTHLDVYKRQAYNTRQHRWQAYSRSSQQRDAQAYQQAC